MIFVFFFFVRAINFVKVMNQPKTKITPNSNSTKISVKCITNHFSSSSSSLVCGVSIYITYTIRVCLYSYKHEKYKYKYSMIQ